MALFKISSSGTISEVYRRMFKPTSEITDDAHAVHGQTKSKLADRPTFLAADAIEIANIVRGSAGLVVHNKTHEARVLHSQFSMVGQETLLDRSWFPKFICTQEMARSEVDHQYQTSLKFLSLKYFNAQQPKKHTALWDAEMCAKLFLKLR